MNASNCDAASGQKKQAVWLDSELLDSDAAARKVTNTGQHITKLSGLVVNPFNPK